MIDMDLVRTLRCEIEVPPDCRKESPTTRHIIDLDAEKRKFRRIPCEIGAAMKYYEGSTPIRHSTSWWRIMVRNLSRCGMGFWHSEPMYPLEKALIVFPSGIQRIFEMKRCRRIRAKCFEVGGEFSELLDDPAAIG